VGHYRPGSMRSLNSQVRPSFIAEAKIKCTAPSPF
jgi:hypothetical protein